MRLLWFVRALDQFYADVCYRKTAHSGRSGTGSIRLLLSFDRIARTAPGLDLLRAKGMITSREYDALVSEHCVDPHQAAGAEADLSICNPLSQHEESPWSSFFETVELRNEIQKDLSRLHPGYSREGEDHPFFAAASVQESMLQLS